MPTPGSLPCTILLSPWSSPLSKPLLEAVGFSGGVAENGEGGRAGFGGEPYKIHPLCLLPVLQQGWNITVDLVIGPKGIRQMTSKEAKVGVPEKRGCLGGGCEDPPMVLTAWGRASVPSPPAWLNSSTSSPSGAPAWRRAGPCCSWGSVAPPR